MILAIKLCGGIFPLTRNIIMKFRQLLVFACKALAIAGFSVAANAATMTYNGSAASNVDTWSPTQLTLNVGDTGLLTNLSVYINIGQYYADDITLSLIHDGTTVKLYDGHGDSPYSTIDATFTDSASSGAPYNGSAIGIFLPVQSLSAFYGKNIFGAWTLELQDFVVPGDETPLYGWGITTTSGPLPPVTAGVPEPGMLALFGIGLLGIGLARRRSRQA